MELSLSELTDDLRARAYRHFKHLTQRAKGYPRLQVFLGYQQAALELVEKAGGSLGDQARVVLDERFPDPRGGTLEPPEGFPGPEQAIGFTSFITELAKHQTLRQVIWPEDDIDNFRQRFRKREQRRELLSAMARLGASYIDLYLLAVKQLGSFTPPARNGGRTNPYGILRAHSSSFSMTSPGNLGFTRSMSCHRRHSSST